MALRIHQSQNKRAAKEYYTQAMTRPDYYGRDGRAASAWIGLGAERLGLSGEVSKEAFFALLENRTPEGGKLTVRDGARRRPGWDIVLSGPKSVSVLRAIAGDERIWEAQWQSAIETLADIERDGIRTRDRRGGRDGTTLTKNLVGSLFGHDTTRPLGDGRPDMHDHFHAFVHNSTWSEQERRWQAAELFDVYVDRSYYQAAFEARLAKRLAGLGYRIERHADGWEIAGVPRSVIEKFSRRTSQIEAEAARRGITDAVAKDRLGAKLRQKKGNALPPGELRSYWDGKLTSEERQAVHDAFTKAAGSDGGQAEPGPSADQAVAHAVEHCFARDSTLPEKRLLAEALRYGVGAVTPQSLRPHLHGHGLVVAESGKRRVRTATVREAYAEEQYAIRFARDGRGVCDPLGGFGGRHVFRRDYLNAGQRGAVRHLLESFDRLLILAGKAGVGKSSALIEAVEAIEANGRKVFAFAPTTKATNVLKREGFADARTVAALLQDERLQAPLEGNVLLIDEAGFLGTRTMARLLDLAERYGTRVILSGDSSQHRSPERGAALRLLEEFAGVPAACITEIVRQEGPLKRAVAALGEGRGEDGFDRLQALGCVREVPDAGRRYGQLASDYVRAMKEGKEVLAIAPRHSEGAKVVSAIRAELKRQGRLGGDERELLRLESANLTAAQLRDAVNYRPGDTVQFLQNAPGWRRGDRATVTGRDGKGGVRVRASSGDEKPLPLDLVGRFQLYHTGRIALAAGDRIRITQNGFTDCRGGKKHRLDNGDVHTLAGFTQNGEPVLENGWVLPKHFGHLAGGWVATSHASQGDTIGKKGDAPRNAVRGHVFLAQSAESFPASSLEQFYVSCSRARDGVRIYCDDAAGLRRAVSRSDRPLSATELLGGGVMTREAMEDRLRYQRYLATVRAGATPPHHQAIPSHAYG